MRPKILLALTSLFLLSVSNSSKANVHSRPSTQEASEPSSMVGRVRDTGFLQLTVDAFNDLTSNQKLDAYWLSMAAIAVNPIAYDQNSVYGLQEKRVLEAILTHPNGIDPNLLKKITEYTMLFWGNQGNHNAFTSRKILPDFTFADLRNAAEQARKNGATQLGTLASLLRVLTELEKPIFDSTFQPMLTVKNPPSGQDPLEASCRELLFGRHAEGFDGLHGALRVEFAAVKGPGRQAGGGSVSRGHAGPKLSDELGGRTPGASAAGTLRSRAWTCDSRSAASGEYAPDHRRKSSTTSSAITRPASARTGFVRD